MKEQQLEKILKKQDSAELTKLFQNGGLADMKKICLADLLAEAYLNQKVVDVQFIGTLISFDAVELDSRTRSGQTPLMMAIHLENDELAKLLINQNVDVNAIDKKGMNAFMWAVALGNANVVNMLIENNVDIHAKATFMIDYKENELDDDLTLALNNDSELKFKPVELSAFAFSCNTYSQDVMKTLIEQGFNVNEPVIKNDHVINFIMKPEHYNFYSKAEYAKSGILINAYDTADNRSSSFYHTAISEACNRNDTEMVQLLLEHGANNFKAEDMLLACENFNFAIIKSLVESGLDVNERFFDGIHGSTALHKLCAHSSIASYSPYLVSDGEVKKEEIFEIIKYLISKGANVNIDSPLMAACSFIDYIEIFDRGEERFYGDINRQVVELLIEKGADVNYSNESTGKSILMEVCDKKVNGYEIAKILIDSGANVNAKDFEKNTPLMHLQDEWFNKEGYEEDDKGSWKTIKFEKSTSEQILELLIENGADINARNSLGMTALMKHAFEGRKEIVQLLLEHGADINVKSELTAFDLATDNDLKELIKSSQNNEPQKLVSILTNFTIDKPVKYTTHGWDFGDLRNSDYKNFEGFMDAVKNQFENFADELKTLSPNLHKKIYTFLMDENPDDHYSWSQKADINIGWSSLKGLQEHCDNNMKPDTFRLKEPFIVGNQEITTFGEVINLFKQEIEIRNDYKSVKYLDKSLEELFVKQRKKILGQFNMDLSASKLERQFYTDTEKFDIVLGKIFSEIIKRTDHKTIKVMTNELSDRSLEIRIVHVGSFAPLDADGLLDEARDGDFSDIKESLKNLCDWSCENSFEGQSYRVNYLHSNNVKDIEPLENTPEGFTYIMRFYTK